MSSDLQSPENDSFFQKAKRFLYTFARNNIPLAIFLVLISIVIALSTVGLAPTPDELFAFMKDKYERYGLIALFVSTFIEGFMMVGMYYIGSWLIILAVILADGNPVMFIQLVVTVWAAISLISIVNFTIGRHTKVYDSKPNFGFSERTSWRKFVYFVHPTLIAYYTYSLGRAQKPYSSLIYVSFFTLISAISLGILITVVHQLTSNIITFLIMPFFLLAFILLSQQRQ